MIPESHWLVLRKLCTVLDQESITWALTGSTGLALQGVPVEVHDIDVQAGEAEVYRIERCFAGCVTRKVAFSSTDRIASHLGALLIDDVEVELMGGIQGRLPSGEWGPSVDVAEKRLFVEAHGLNIPVISLEREYEGYTNLGRTEKARLIKETLERQGQANPADSSHNRRQS